MKITINNLEWQLNFVPSNCLPLGECGQCSAEDLTINILQDMNPLRQRIVIIHELTHAFFFSQGRGCVWEDMNEEQVCEFVAWNIDAIYDIAQEVHTEELRRRNKRD